MVELKEQQKAFCDYYLETGNATEAYKKAYPKCKTDNAAAASSSKALRNPKILAYINDRLAQIESQRIAKPEEVLQYLTAVMRGEEKDQFGFDAALADRTRAAELLGKRYRLFTDKVELDGSAVVQIIDDLPKDDDDG